MIVIAFLEVSVLRFCTELACYVDVSIAFQMGMINGLYLIFKHSTRTKKLNYRYIEIIPVIKAIGIIADMFRSSSAYHWNP